MPRKNLIRTSSCPYHITIRSNNRDWFDISLDKMWNICIAAIKYANNKHLVKVQAFVLMSNHYHLIIWTPNSDIDRFMFYLNYQISKSVRIETGRINRIFGDRYKWSLIKDQKYYLIVLRYIYQNPIRAALSKRCENYKYSTIFYHIRNNHLGIQLFNPIHGNQILFLKWINENTDKTLNTQLHKAIRKPTFKIPVNPTSRRI